MWRSCEGAPPGPAGRGQAGRRRWVRKAVGVMPVHRVKWWRSSAADPNPASRDLLDRRSVCSSSGGRAGRAGGDPLLRRGAGLGDEPPGEGPLRHLRPPGQGGDGECLVRWSTIQSSTGCRLSADDVGTGRSTYWRWPPSRCGGTTIRRAIRVATALPSSVRPGKGGVDAGRGAGAGDDVAVAHEEHVGSTLASGLARELCGCCQWVVQLRPSRRPAAPSVKAPEHTDMTRPRGRPRRAAPARPPGTGCRPPRRRVRRSGRRRLRLEAERGGTVCRCASRAGPGVSAQTR